MPDPAVDLTPVLPAFSHLDWSSDVAIRPRRAEPSLHPDYLLRATMPKFPALSTPIEKFGGRNLIKRNGLPKSAARRYSYANGYLRGCPADGGSASADACPRRSCRTPSSGRP